MSAGGVSDDERGEWESDCPPGPVQVSLEVRGGRVTDAHTYVGGRWRPANARTTDLGTLPARQAAVDLLALAEGSRTDAEDLVTAATLVDSAVVWPTLLRLAHRTDLPLETRRQAVFWLGQAAGEAATRGLDSLAGDAGGELEVRKQAVSVLSVISVFSVLSHYIPPMRPPLHILLAAGALLAAACGEKKPPAAVVTLGPAADTLPTTLSEATSAAWLGGGRWAVLSAPDERVEIADIGSGKVTPLAGGAASKELRNPSTLFRAGDTLYVGDWGLRRTSRWTLDGRFAGAVPVSDAVRGVLPRARDAEGRFYLELTPRPGADGRGNRDSAAVARAGAALDRADTTARLAPLDIAEVVGDAGRRFERRVFSGADQWGALPDGSIWVGRVYDNRVDWRDPSGKWTRGEPLPDRVLEVTRYDRELFLRRFPPELRGTAEQLPFAAVKPPFEAGLTSPSGQAWLEKSRAPADSSRRYHVVDRQGRLVEEIRVPGHGRIIAVAPGAVLVAEPSRDGVRLLRYPLPAVPETAQGAS